MCLYQRDHEQQVRRWAVPAGTQDTSDWRPERLSVGMFFKGGIFALIMLIILQVSAFPGLLQTSGIYDLSDFYLLWGNFLLKGTQEVRRDVQQSCVISGFVILVLHSEASPPNQTIENVYVRMFCVSASSTPGNVLLGNKHSSDRGSFYERLIKREACFVSSCFSSLTSTSTCKHARQYSVPSHSLT